MPTFQPQKLTEGSQSFSYSAAAADDALDLSIAQKPAGFIFKNTGATTVTVTITINALYASQTDLNYGVITKSSITLTIPAAVGGVPGEIIGFLPPSWRWYLNSSGVVPISYSTLTGVTKAAFWY